MKKIPKFIVVFLVIFVFIGCDQKAKSLAKEYLQFSNPIQCCGGMVQLVFTENEGGFLSIGSQLPFAFRKIIALILTLITTVGFIVLLVSAHRIRTMSVISFSLIISGAFGNLIDRLMNQGRVIDFILLGTNTMHTGIFNIADVLIMAGTCILVVSQLFGSKHLAKTHNLP